MVCSSSIRARDGRALIWYRLRVFLVAIWDQDSEDSVGATVAESKAIYDSAVAAKPSNMLFLNHEVYSKHTIRPDHSFSFADRTPLTIRDHCVRHNLWIMAANEDY